MSSDRTETDESPRIAEDTPLAKGVYETFFEKNREGIMYVDAELRIYYISRSHTLRGPIPPGAIVAHTGLASPVWSKPTRRAKKRH